MRRFFAPPILALSLLAVGAAPHAAWAEDTLSPLHFQSHGPFGTIDKAAAQRGYQVFETACAGCHALGQVHYRDLEALGLTPDQAAGEAAAAGGTLSAPLKGAAPMDMGGAVPPDLSSIVAQRHGTSYIYRFLTSFGPAPDGVSLLPGHYYNAAFPGGQVAMPPVLRDNAVTYADGTAATSAQEASDVAEFLTWTSDPNLDTRHQIGLRAMIFLGFLAIIAIASKRRVWSANI
jgi:ubiquinol-cytochrome c reductase cytochrome c1 subunit